MRAAIKLGVPIFALMLSTAAGSAYAASPGPVKDPHADMKVTKGQAAPVSGEVTETLNGGGYSYICIEEGGKKTWVATPQISVKVGDHIAFYPGSVMTDFESKTLHRTFKQIVFSPGPMVLPGTSAAKAQAGKAGSKPVGRIKVKKASGPGAHTVAELYGKAAELSGKKVTVSGKVVKVSAGIMGKNWLHIEDGTGDAAKGTGSLVVTTMDSAKVGDVVTLTGTLAHNKDFGYGYRYNVILEDASLKK